LKLVLITLVPCSSICEIPIGPNCRHANLTTGSNAAVQLSQLNQQSCWHVYCEEAASTDSALAYALQVTEGVPVFQLTNTAVCMD
jgi:hypothetical protein